MATSGAYLFNPTVAEFVDEAFERCKLDPATLTLRHIVSARRSLALLLKHLPNRHPLRQWAMDEQTEAMTVGKSSFSLPVGTLDVFSMQLRRSDVDTPMALVSRSDYHAIHDKAQQGRPDRYFVDRQIGQPVVHFWQAGENTTDEIHYWRMRVIQDVGAASNTLDIPDRFHEPFAAGLAAKLAEKWADPQLEAKLIAKAERALGEAMIEDRDRAPVRLSVRMR